jgi:hypothetical protein
MLEEKNVINASEPVPFDAVSAIEYLKDNIDGMSIRVDKLNAEIFKVLSGESSAGIFKEEIENVVKRQNALKEFALNVEFNLKTKILSGSDLESVIDRQIKRLERCSQELVEDHWTYTKELCEVTDKLITMTEFKLKTFQLQEHQVFSAAVQDSPEIQ